MNSINFAAALGGGVMIGAAALLLMATNGKIAGISGILAQTLWPTGQRRQWQLWFLLGLLGTGIVLTGIIKPAKVQAANLSDWLMLGVAGFLVGIGTQLGGGCTSGHGICGLGRRSKRSLVAVAIFMAVAMLTVFVMRHVVGVRS